MTVAGLYMKQLRLEDAGQLLEKCREEVACYGAMVQSSRLRYNNAAANLNRSLLRFPTRLIAGALGFHRRAYLEY